MPWDHGDEKQQTQRANKTGIKLLTASNVFSKEALLSERLFAAFHVLGRHICQRNIIERVLCNSLLIE